MALSLSLEAGVLGERGRLAPGAGYGAEDVPATPPQPLADILGPELLPRLSLQVGTFAGAVLEGGYSSSEWRVRTAHLVLGAGPVLLWGGRRPVGFGPGEGGGVVLGDEAFADGGGLQLRTPMAAPGFLRWLGPIHFETALGRAEDSGTVERPWFWAARGSIEPHPRIAFGINRAALFSGDNVEFPVRDLLYLIIGKHGGSGSALENQIVAVDLMYRPPLPWAPELYVEWGFEDSAGAWRAVPGVLWGVALADLPGVAGARLGVERATFARSCCGNPIWYRHMFLLGGWTQDGEVLGHPLGGHGEEWLVHGSTGLLRESLQLRGAVAMRDRSSENLYAPTRTGRSRAGRLALTWVAEPWQVTARGEVESGDGWTESLLRLGVRLTR